MAADHNPIARWRVPPSPGSGACRNLTARLHFHMPTVLDANGFQVRVLLPPREHGPPHVHVYKGGGEIVITLPDGESPPAIRTIHGMKSTDVVAAVRLVEGHLVPLRAAWRTYHG